MEKKTFKEKESPEDRVKRLRIRDWNDDAFLVAEHLRQPSVKPRDPNVWTKTPKERKLWKKFRRVPAPNYNWSEPVKIIDIPVILLQVSLTRRPRNLYLRLRLVISVSSLTFLIF